MNRTLRLAIWLAVTFVIWHGFFYGITFPHVGAFYHLEGWLIRPVLAVSVTAFVNWLAFLPALWD